MAAMQATPDAIPDGVQEMEQDDGTRVECRSCGRKFKPEAVEKHEKICQKVFIQKRKAFNTKDQRKADGLEEIQREQQYSKPYGKKNQRKEPPKSTSKPGGAIPKWKQQSLQFRQAMQASSGSGPSGGGSSNFNPS